MLIEKVEVTKDWLNQMLDFIDQRTIDNKLSYSLLRLGIYTFEVVYNIFFLNSNY